MSQPRLSRQCPVFPRDLLLLPPRSWRHTYIRKMHATYILIFQRGRGRLVGPANGRERERERYCPASPISIIRRTHVDFLVKKRVLVGGRKTFFSYLVDPTPALSVTVQSIPLTVFIHPSATVQEVLRRRYRGPPCKPSPELLVDASQPLVRELPEWPPSTVAVSVDAVGAFLLHCRRAQRLRAWAPDREVRPQCSGTRVHVAVLAPVATGPVEDAADPAHCFLLI